MAQTAARKRHVPLAALPPEVLARVLGFFRSTKYLDRDVLATPDEWDWEDGTFLEEKTTLKNVLNVACCSRATRDVALGDLVWAPHCAAMEANLPVGPRQYRDRYDLNKTTVLPESLMDPRMLDPQKYASLSPLHRYWAVRGFYTRIKKELEAFGKEINWDEDDISALQGLADFCALRVQHAGLDSDEEDDALQGCNPSTCAYVAIESFVLREFMQGGVSGHALDLLVGRWSLCNPCCGSSSTQDFLYRVTDCEHWG